jgi:hypothetical protein
VGHITAGIFPWASNGLLPFSIAVASASVRWPASTLARSSLTFPSFGRVFTVGVGHNPESVSLVWGTNGGSRYAIPLRVITERGQVPVNLGCGESVVDSQEVSNVLQQDVTRS